MKEIIHTNRRAIVIVIHLGLTVVANYAAFLLRFDGVIPPEHVQPFLRALPWLVLVRAVFFAAFRLHEGLWRYFSLFDFRTVVVSVTLGSAVFAVVVPNLVDLTPYPRSVFVLDWLLMIGLASAVRLVRRSLRDFRRLSVDRRVLIYGAGDAGEMVVRDVKNNQYYNWEPVGFVDDDPAKRGRTIHGVKVLGGRDDLPAIIATVKAQEVLVAIAAAAPSELRDIVKALEPYRIPIKTLPNLRDVFEGKIQVSQIRNLSLEDLIMRAPVAIDPEPVRRLVNGRRVLVTGAGGSIGSELSRQLVQFGPARLLLLEQYENTLFELCNDLQSLAPEGNFEPIIADITDAARIDQLFADRRPEIVFHAAAHKHVPLMELNPCEAVKNNVVGTRTLAEAAMRHGVGEFVLISSDKAVNPSSVMGATKRVAEDLIRALVRPDGTRLMAVRFGNVLGSHGSVTTIFEAQIKRGGPVTLTHPEMRRYFMLIPEAVQLVLHAAAMRDAGLVYALDMGEPIPIVDLARNLIRLSGFVPDEEIQIQYVGLRPGEKLYEELAEAGEALEESGVAGIRRVRCRPVALDDLLTRIDRLVKAAQNGQDADVLAQLSTLVPTFRQSVRDAVTPLPVSGAAAGPRIVKGVKGFGV